ncbi:MAG TPA: hypothetical protein VNO54_19910 [Streptosporangiaceae bacterium]|nr:hypothetical protein [Streptosporangiaceae bacterium]
MANGINAVHLSYAREKAGHALTGARQWIPREHIADPVGSLRMGLPAEVEAVLATRASPFGPPQYVDPVALASLIVAIASLAWTVYTDLKERTAKPSAELVSRTVRVTRRDQGQADAPDHIIEVVVTETIRAVACQDRAEG